MRTTRESVRVDMRSPTIDALFQDNIIALLTFDALFQDNAIISTAWTGCFSVSQVGYESMNVYFHLGSLRLDRRMNQAIILVSKETSRKTNL